MALHIGSLPLPNVFSIDFCINSLSFLFGGGEGRCELAWFPILSSAAVVIILLMHFQYHLTKCQ